MTEYRESPIVGRQWCREGLRELDMLNSLTARWVTGEWLRFEKKKKNINQTITLYLPWSVVPAIYSPVCRGGFY